MILTLAQVDSKPGETLKDAAAKKDSSKAEKPAAKTEEKAVDAKTQASTETTAKTQEPAGTPWYKHGAMGYMIDGGIFMWPILFLGVLAAGVIIERIRSLRMLRTDTEKLRRDVQEMLHEGRAEEALELVSREQGPVPAILSAGLRKYVVLSRLNYDPAKIEEQVVKAMEDYGVHIVGALERHLPILATVSSVAPMLGFLGTVQGMVIAFDDLVRLMGTGNIIELAAAGIRVALLTTVLGLIVGIPAFTAYNYFTGVINRFVLEVEESASELIETVTLKSALEAKREEPATV